MSAAAEMLLPLETEEIRTVFAIDGRINSRGGSAWSRPGWVGRFAAASSLAFAMVIPSAVPAQATPWHTVDYLDQPSNWQSTVVGVGRAEIKAASFPGTSPGVGHYGALASKGTGFSALSKHIYPQPASPSSSCMASVFIQRAYYFFGFYGPPVRVNIEVINPKTWTYVAFTQIQSPSYMHMLAVGVGPWTNSPLDVVFRVSLLGDGAPTDRMVYFDNVGLTCNEKY